MSLIPLRELIRNVSLLATATAATTLAANGMFASLNSVATNATPQSVSAGTLKLTLANQGSFGTFSDAISNLAIGDTVNRYVDLVNKGSLEAKDLTLAISSSADSTATLVSDGVSGGTNKALTVTVRSCAVAWSANGTCSAAGGAKTEVASTALGSFGSAKTLSSVTLAGGVDDTIHLQISVSLPDQSETVVNGVLPANTVQGGTAHITYTFSGVQRLATVTNS